MEEMRCIIMTKAKPFSSIPFLTAILIQGCISSASADIWPVGKYPLSFGFHNMLSGAHDYETVFEICLENNITVHSVEFEWREDRIPGMYYWGRSDSIVIAAHNAMKTTGVTIELRCRFDVNICNPIWAPYPDPIPVQGSEFSITRLSEYEYYSEMLDYLEIFLERYRPGGVLSQEMGWDSYWGITTFDIFGEMDLSWHGIGDDGYHIDPLEMHLDELAELYSDYREALEAIEPDVSIPFSTLSNPFFEKEIENQSSLRTETEYIDFVRIFREHLEGDLGKPPIDEFDWHTFSLYNDPLNPGIYPITQPYWLWPEKSLSNRSYLISDSIFSDIDIPISTFEGAATCYWSGIQAEGVELNHRNHIVFQLSALAEISVNGKTRVLTFDSTIDDGVTSDLGEYYTHFEEWWDDSEQSADSVFHAYARMATLLSGHFCTGRHQSSFHNPVIRFDYYNPVKRLHTYLLRAKLDTGTNHFYRFPVCTNMVLVYRMLDDPVLISCPNNVCILEPGLDWDIVWVKEIRISRDETDVNTPLRVSGQNPGRESTSFILSPDLANVDYIAIFDISGRCITRVPVASGNDNNFAILQFDGGVEGNIPSGNYFAIPEGFPDAVVRFSIVR